MRSFLSHGSILSISVVMVWLVSIFFQVSRKRRPHLASEKHKVGSQFICILVFVLLCSLSFNVKVEAAPNTTQTFVTCGVQFGLGEMRRFMVSEALDRTIAHTIAQYPENSESFFEWGVGPPDDDGLSVPIFWGSARCGIGSQTLTKEECKVCLESAKMQLMQRCPGAMSAMITLVDCSLRYSFEEPWYCEKDGTGL